VIAPFLRIARVVDGFNHDPLQPPSLKEVGKYGESI